MSCLSYRCAASDRSAQAAQTPLSCGPAAVYQLKPAELVWHNNSYALLKLSSSHMMVPWDPQGG